VSGRVRTKGGIEVLQVGLPLGARQVDLADEEGVAAASRTLPTAEPMAGELRE
jgi:hypothetical protein